MKLLLFILPVFFIYVVTGCSSKNLVDDIYQHTYDTESKESVTAFIILSNIYLSEKNIERIEKDYKKEKDRGKRYCYEFLLAKRTQEEKYISAFIKSSEDSFALLMKNNSNWISIANPIYKQLAHYSKTNDDALNILFKLIKTGDGASLSIVAEDLSELKKINPKRFLKALHNTGTTEAEIINIMEDE